MPKTFAFAAALAATLATGLAATGAQAHARLAEASPAAGAAVAAPARVTLRFSEPLVARFSTFELAGPAGPAPVKVTAHGDTLTGAPAGPLAPGAYTVTWRVVSDDTHHTQGRYAFTVR